ncbi:hypothetical protein BCL76_1327 [Streptomyces sp. CG 926]|nr:hypothetical protein BCL76_1327 [Streptomyces sp. CG 926]
MLTKAVIFHNAPDIAGIVRRLQEEGYLIAPEVWLVARRA